MEKIKSFGKEPGFNIKGPTKMRGEPNGLIIKNGYIIGKWGDTKILDSSFVELSLNPVFDDSPFYGYGWWLYEYEGKKVFTMNGHRGQFVISFPDENIIIVRQGDFNNKGRVSERSGDLYQYIAEGYKLATAIE